MLIAWPLTLSLLALPGCAGSEQAPTGDDTSDITASDTQAPTDSGTLDEGSPLDLTGDRPTNLLFITLDTLRRDRVGRWDVSDKASSTPFLDSLLEESVVLEDHGACSNWTLSSMLCLLTGASTVDLGFEPLSGDFRVASVPEEMPTTTRTLARAGYRAAAVSGSPFVTQDFTLTATGFERVHYEDLGRSDFSSADWMVAGAKEEAAILQATGDPWYLYLHFMDAHAPFDTHLEEQALEGVGELVPLDLDVTDRADFQEIKDTWNTLDAEGQTVIRQHVDAYYRSDLRYLDGQLELLWEHLEVEGLLDDTLVVFWSDHGEQFWDHGQYAHDQNLYGEETLSVAFFWSKSLQPGSWEGPTLHQDVFPTVFDLLGLDAMPPESTGRVIGREDAPRFRHAFRYSTSNPVQMAIEADGLRMYYDWTGDKALFDLAADPLETEDLYDAEDPAVLDFWTELDGEISRVQEFIKHLEPIDRGP